MSRNTATVSKREFRGVRIDDSHHLRDLLNGSGFFECKPKLLPHETGRLRVRSETMTFVCVFYFVLGLMPKLCAVQEKKKKTFWKMSYTASPKDTDLTFPVRHSGDFS